MNMVKYELNKPYDFEVKNLVSNNGKYYFQVEINGNLFPVKAYPEQLEQQPSSVSCRIVLDKNEKAILVQNEAFLFPYIYKPDRRYVFEIVDIRDKYVILQDNYGSRHYMIKDGTEFSLNEIIVCYVEIVNDKDRMAHLRFLYSKHYVDDESVITTQLSTEHKEESLSSMISNKKWEELKIYFSKKLIGKEIRSIQQEVAAAILNINSASIYWEIVQFLLRYNARVFLGTLANIDGSHIINNVDQIDALVLDDIIHNAFLDSQKTRYALEIITPCKKQLTAAQRNYIKNKCLFLNNCEAFYDLFELLDFSDDEKISYLLSLQNNYAAAYMLYKLYLDYKNNGLIKEESVSESLRPSKILEYIHIMERSNSRAQKMAANLIGSNILMTTKNYSLNLQKEVSENGYLGFVKIIKQKDIDAKSKLFLSAKAIGDLLDGLKYINETDNYYVFIEQHSGAYALLIKTLTENKPSKEVLSQAKIFKILKHKGKTFFIVVQKPTISIKIPPLVNRSTILNVDFSKGRNGDLYPVVKNYCKLVNVVVESRPRFFNYKIRHKVEIINMIDFFTYGARIIGDAEH